MLAITPNLKKISGALAVAALAAFSAPSSALADIKGTFSVANQSSTTAIDHTVWDGLLKKYVKPGSDGLNSVDYTAFKNEAQEPLKAYIKSLEKVNVPALNKQEQFAFWANLYNAVTIDVVLDNMPVKSIKDIDISGFFSDGPWGKKLVKVNGLDLSLNDIEHGIMRPIFRDPRVHYAVNCASIGCPNLLTAAFTGADLEKQLDANAKAYVNHPRGVRVENGRVIASKIYSWFDEDFGNSERGVLKHVSLYAEGALAEKLKGKTDIYDYEYDWGLNNVAQ